MHVGAGSLPKQSRRWLSHMMAAATVIGLVSGCSTLIDGSAVRAAGEPAGGIDIALLDVGNFPTKPAPLGRAVTSLQGAIVEGQRLANFVTGPWEIDPSLTSGSLLSGLVLKNGNALKAVLAPEMAAVASSANMVTGFHAWRGNSKRLTLEHTVLVFADPDAAKAAAREFGDAAAAANGGNGSQHDIPGRSDTTAIASTFEESGLPPLPMVLAVTPHERYVLIDSVRSPDGVEVATAMVTKTLELQLPLLDTFTPTDPAKLSDLPLDPTGLVARTLPVDMNRASVNSRAAYDRRGALHFQTDPVAAAARWDKSGMTRQALADTSVTENKDGDAAEQLLQDLVKEVKEQGHGEPANPVKQMSNSRCLKLPGGTKGSNRPSVYCAATAGRYVISSQSAQLLEAQQKVAAQYVMLMAP